MRGLLAIVVVVVQVTGPWLCCCGPLGDITAVRPVAYAADGPKSQTKCPHCRTGDANAGSKHESPEKPTKHGSGEPQHRCPYEGACRDSLPASTADDGQAKVAGVLLFANAFTLNVLEPLVPLPAASVEPPGTTLDPFLTTETRLFAHHALRC